MFVYTIVNSATLKQYIGQHKGTNLRQYLQQKWSEAHHNISLRSRLYASMRKHPRECWSIHPILSDLTTRQECDDWERFYIKKFHTQNPEYGYNISRGGDGGVGRAPGFTHSLATRQKMSLRAIASGQRPSGNAGRVFSEEWRQHISDAQRGKTLTVAHKRNISTANKGKQNTLGHALTPEHKEKIRKALMGRVFTAEWREKISKAKMGNLGGRIRWDRAKEKK